MFKAVSALMIALALANVTPHIAFAEGELAADAKEAGQDIKKGAKKAGRKIKDETCEMINGKMECAAKKAGHKLQNAGDEIKDKVN